MEDGSHPSFPQPPNLAATLWRYLDVWKFQSLLEAGRLYMPPADRLGDHLEGTTPQAEIDWWDAKIAAAETDEQRGVMLHNKRFFASMSATMRQRYFVSCWHMNDYESSVMWGAYTSSSDAVAIRTTFSALRGALPAFVYLGMVRYIDFDTTRFGEGMPNMFDWIMHKEAIYRGETEVRAVVYPPATDEHGLGEFKASFYEHTDEPEKLVYAPQVKPAELIHAVVVHPAATPEFMAKIAALCAAHHLPPPVRSRGARAAIY